MNHLMYFGGVFLLVSLFHVLFLNKRRLKKGNLKDMGEATYVIYKFKLNKKKINPKEIVYTMGFINALIIAFVCMLIVAIPLSMIYRMAIGFVLLFGLIYSIYEIYGRYLVSRGWGKDDKKL